MNTVTACKNFQLFKNFQIYCRPEQLSNVTAAIAGKCETSNLNEHISVTKLLVRGDKINFSEYSLGYLSLPCPEWKSRWWAQWCVSCRYVLAWCRSEYPEKSIFFKKTTWKQCKKTGGVLCMVECAVSLALPLALACEMSGGGLEKETDSFFSKFPFYPFTQIKDKKTQNYTGSFYFIPLFVTLLSVWNWYVGPYPEGFMITLFVVTQSIWDKIRLMEARCGSILRSHVRIFSCLYYQNAKTSYLTISSRYFFSLIYNLLLHHIWWLRKLN